MPKIKLTEKVDKETRKGDMYIMVQGKPQHEVVVGVKSGNKFFPLPPEDDFEIITLVSRGENKGEGVIYRLSSLVMCGALHPSGGGNAEAEGLPVFLSLIKEEIEVTIDTDDLEQPDDSGEKPEPKMDPKLH